MRGTTEPAPINCPVCGCGLAVQTHLPRSRWNKPQIELAIRLHRLTVGQKAIARVFGADLYSVRHLLARVRARGGRG